MVCKNSILCFQLKIRVRAGIKLPLIYLTHAVLKIGSIFKFGRNIGLQELNLVHWNAVEPIVQIQASALAGRTTRTLLGIFSGNLFRIRRLVASWAERAREDIGNGCCMSPEATWARFCFFWAIDKKMTSIVIDKLHLKWRKYYLQSGVVAMHLCILHSLPFGAQNEIAQVSIELGQIVAKNIKQINSNGKCTCKNFQYTS